jgi:hypothetical protein
MNAIEDPLIREVEEDLRRDRMAALWRRWGPTAIGVAVVVVLAVAGYEGWKSWRREASEAAGLRFQQATALGVTAPEQTAEAFAALAEDAPDGYAMLARLRQARAQADAGDPAAATDAYRRLAEDASDPLFRDLATLSRVIVALGAAEGEGVEVDPQALAHALEPLISGTNPWRYSARELQALLALRTGDSAKAREILTALGEDAAAPPELRTRAGYLLRQIGRG